MAAAITPEDLLNFRWVDHVRLSRDGERVAYQVGWADGPARQNRSRVVVRRLLDAEPVDATGGSQRDHSPEWSPDGRKLAFVSRVGAADQVFVLDFDAGSPAAQVSSVPEGASHPSWSPDGTRLAFVGTVLGDPDGVVDDPRQPEGRDQVRRAPVARVVRRLDYKHDGMGYVDGRYHHLFVVEAAGGLARQLTSGAWDVAGFDWSPDGARIVVAGNAEPNADLQRDLNLYLVDLEGRRQRLGGGFELSSPIWSPRGDLIAFIAPKGLDVGLNERLWVVPVAGGGPRCLTADLDIAVGDGVITDMRSGHDTRICWSEEGDRVYFIASGPGVTGLYSVDLEGNSRLEAGGRRRIYDFDLARGAIAFCAADSSTPGELRLLTNGAEATLTDMNPWLRDRYVAQPEQHYFTAPDGWKLEGWVLKPQDFQPGRLYPTVMEIHGGPHGQYGWAFFHELQVLAGMGYVVFYMNPRGSDGYGELFRRAVVRDWGGKDYVDLMTSLDQLIERTGYIDVSRIGVGGGSYGGYMTNWIVGQTNRFSAAVSMRSISNLVSEYAQHDIVLWGALELGPPPWPDMDELWRRSPIRYVQNVQTPLLLTAGEMDLRCAMSQSEEMFGALRLLGKTVELVRFPEETHDLSRNGRPDRRVERLRRITAWYERFLGTRPVERPSEEATQTLPVPAAAAHEWAKTIALAGASTAEPAQAATEPEPGPEPEVIQPVVPEPTSRMAQIVEPEALPDLPEPQREGAGAEMPEMTTEAYPVLPLASPNGAEALEAAAPQETAAGDSPAAVETASEPVQEAAPLDAIDLQAEAVVLEPEPAPGPEAESRGDEEPAVPEVPEVQPGQELQPLFGADAAAMLAEAERGNGERAVEPEPSVGSVAEAAPEAEPVAQAEPELEPEPQPVPVAEVAQEPEPVADVAPEPEPVAEVAQEPEPVAEVETEPVAGLPTEPEAVAEVQAETVAEAAPEPEPEPASQPSSTPGQQTAAEAAPVAEPDPRATLVAWPTVTPSSGNGSSSEGFDEATSVIPAWQHPDTAAKRTVSLQALPPEEVATGGGYAALLTFESGPFAGRIVAVPDQMVTIGRAPDNDVVIGDPATSGHHGRIEMRTGSFWISDLGSTNGTLVNGEPVIEKELAEGDLISIGQSSIRFTLEA